MSRKSGDTQKQSKEIIYKVYYFFKALRGKHSDVLQRVVNTPQLTTAKACGVSERTVRRICAEGRLSGAADEETPSTSFSSPKKRHRRCTTTHINDEKKELIRRTVLEFYDRKEFPTTQKVQTKLHESCDFEGSLSSVKRILKNLGFMYKKGNDGRKFLTERVEIVAARISFLRRMNRIRACKDPRPVIYLNETCFNMNHTSQHIWIDSTTNSGGSNVPTGKEGRLIICHAGSAQHGFFPHTKLVFQSGNTNNDCHKEMTAELFTSWFMKLLEGLEEGCIIVMDNAPYHCVVKDKAPTTGSRKNEIIEWLRRKEINFDYSLTKPELLTIVKQHKLAKKYVLDEIAFEMGHEVIRLPPNHCRYNPIELIWAQVKEYVSEHNTSFTMATMTGLVHDGINRVTIDDWKKCVERAEKVQDEDFLKEIGRDEEFVEFLPLTDESSSDSDSSMMMF